MFKNVKGMKRYTSEPHKVSEPAEGPAPVVTPRKTFLASATVQPLRDVELIAHARSFEITSRESWIAAADLLAKLKAHRSQVTKAHDATRKVFNDETARMHAYQKSDIEPITKAETLLSNQYIEFKRTVIDPELEAERRRLQEEADRKAHEEAEAEAARLRELAKQTKDKAVRDELKAEAAHIIATTAAEEVKVEAPKTAVSVPVTHEAVVDDLEALMLWVLEEPEARMSLGIVVANESVLHEMARKNPALKIPGVRVVEKHSARRNPTR